MTPDQAATLIDSVNGLHQLLNAFAYTSIGVLCGLVFAVSWRA